MRIRIICPATPGSRSGNRVTGMRWARILRELKHRATIAMHYAGEPCDLLVAMHARRSWDAIRKFAQRYPDHPLIVALTGTDLYRDIQRSTRAQRSLELATRLVVLQPHGLRELPRRLRAKARVIYQSTTPARWRCRQPSDSFDVCVIGHLRAVKDPFRAALAVRRLPPASRIRVLHVGKALSNAMAHRARIEMQRNPRYRWLGERSGSQTRTILASSCLMVLTSRMEGGANVISEAVTTGVPVLATRIPGTCGLLGVRYPGLFPVGGADTLARLLRRAETDQGFYTRLVRACGRLAPLFQPERERRAWARLLHEVSR